MTTARAEAANELSLYIGAANEALSRMDRKTQEREFDTLRRRVTDLTAGKAISLITVASVNKLKQTFESAEEKLGGDIDNLDKLIAQIVEVEVLRSRGPDAPSP